MSDITFIPRDGNIHVNADFNTTIVVAMKGSSAWDQQVQLSNASPANHDSQLDINRIWIMNRDGSEHGYKFRAEQTKRDQNGNFWVTPLFKMNNDHWVGYNQGHGRCRPKSLSFLGSNFGLTVDCDDSAGDGDYNDLQVAVFDKDKFDSLLRRRVGTEDATAENIIDGLVEGLGMAVSLARFLLAIGIV